MLLPLRGLGYQVSPVPGSTNEAQPLADPPMSPWPPHPSDPPPHPSSEQTQWYQVRVSLPTPGPFWIAERCATCPFPPPQGLAAGLGRLLSSPMPLPAGTSRSYTGTWSTWPRSQTPTRTCSLCCPPCVPTKACGGGGVGIDTVGPKLWGCCLVQIWEMRVPG